MVRTKYNSIKNLIEIKDSLNKYDNALNISPYKLSDLAKIIEMYAEDMLYEAESTILH